MNKIFGRNEAGSSRRKNPVVMIISILAVSIFIGSAIQPALADDITLPIKPIKQNLEKKGLCTTCHCAVDFAIDHMIIYVKNNAPPDKEHLFWRVEYVALIWQGLNQGLKLSGFEVKINIIEVMAEIEYWVDEIADGQILPVTRFLANLTAIGAGLLTYLTTLCDNGDPVPQPRARPTQSPVRVIPRFYLIIVFLRLIEIRI